MKKIQLFLFDIICNVRFVCLFFFVFLFFSRLSLVFLFFLDFLSLKVSLSMFALLVFVVVTSITKVINIIIIVTVTSIIRISQMGLTCWGGTIWIKWPKTAWKLQSQHSWGKTVGDIRGGGRGAGWTSQFFG